MPGFRGLVRGGVVADQAQVESGGHGLAEGDEELPELGGVVGAVQFGDHRPVGDATPAYRRCHSAGTMNRAPARSADAPEFTLSATESATEPLRWSPCSSRIEMMWRAVICRPRSVQAIAGELAAWSGLRLAAEEEGGSMLERGSQYPRTRWPCRDRVARGAGPVPPWVRRFWRGVGPAACGRGSAAGWLRGRSG
jgi:hypothetical protein